MDKAIEEIMKGWATGYGELIQNSIISYLCIHISQLEPAL